MSTGPWFYVDRGEQRGPVATADLASWIQSARLPRDVQVWREGLPNWQPFSGVCPPECAAVIGAAVPVGAVPPMSDEAACAECGSVMSKSDMIHNSACPKIEVDPETYEVRVDGKLATSKPAKTLPLTQLYTLR